MQTTPNTVKDTMIQQFAEHVARQVLIAQGAEKVAFFRESDIATLVAESIRAFRQIEAE